MIDLVVARGLDGNLYRRWEGIGNGLYDIFGLRPSGVYLLELYEAKHEYPVAIRKLMIGSN